MELQCFGSSSAGNCYTLSASDGETLMIECGLPMREILKAMRWDISRVAGCLVSHEHRDHSCAVKDMLQRGIRVLALREVFDSHGVAGHHYARAILPHRGYRVGGYKVITLPVYHDVPCLSFVIDHPEMGRLLFVTDTMMLEYRVSGLNHMMLECNYADEILAENIASGSVPASMRDRLLHSHMEIKTTAEIVRTADLAAVNEIVLLHLSDQNGDETAFAERIRKVSGKAVYIARNGLKIDISLQPY